jgi:D-sedoheptulose 7-phosphate isomerase
MTNERKYLEELVNQISSLDLNKLDILYRLIKKVKTNKGTIYICGNGGSAANANHISNDFMLGLNKKKLGVKIISLSSNIAKISCIANDLGYSKIFSHQIKILSKKNDLLILLSGSGNSLNIINAIKSGKEVGMSIFSILGFDGGKAKKISKNFLHCETNDMQISEDIQMICLNYVMKKIMN